MSIAAIISLCAAALQLGMGLLLVGLARAPGWRAARTLALLALTAAAYSAADIVFALPSASDGAVLLASRVNYFVGALHGVAWLLYTFGGPTASPHRMPRPVKIFAAALTVAAFAILVTGAHTIRGQWQDVHIEWANVVYHTPRVHEWAEWYALAILVTVAVPFVVFVPRAFRREPGAAAHLVGFTVFFACMSVEVLVTNGVMSTFYLGDVGFLAVVVPVAVATVRRVVSDAGKLDLLSRKLAGEVKERTVALDRAQDALAEAERHAALGRLAAGVGHEINNPLTYLILSLDEVETWAASSVMPADIRDALTNARDGTERIRLVVDGLRTYTRSAADEYRELSLDTVARNALRVATHQVQHVAQLHVELEPTAPVFGNEAQLVQVVVNLLTNAAQAIAEAGLHRAVSITVRTFTHANSRVVLEVSDTGPGIREQDLGRLSEPYFTTRSRNGGTGLGLFLSRGIVERHQGQFEIDSKVGEGTVARMLLPASVDFVPSEDPDHHAPAVPAAHRDVYSDVVTAKRASSRDSAVAVSDAQTATVAARHRVLLIDDEPLVTRAMARTLSATCEVTTAESGSNALALLGDASAIHRTFDAILCDIMMPEMTGIEFAELLEAHHPTLRRRTIFLTGGAVTPAAVEFLERDDVRHLTKPVTMDNLVKAIAEVALVEQ